MKKCTTNVTVQQVINVTEKMKKCVYQTDSYDGTEPHQSMKNAVKLYNDSEEIYALQVNSVSDNGTPLKTMIVYKKVDHPADISFLKEIDSDVDRIIELLEHDIEIMTLKCMKNVRDLLSKVAWYYLHKPELLEDFHYGLLRRLFQMRDMAESELLPQLSEAAYNVLAYLMDVIENYNEFLEENRKIVLT